MSRSNPKFYKRSRKSSAVSTASRRFAGPSVRRLMPLVLSPGILFPDRLRVNCVAQLTFNNTFASSAYNWSYYNASNPATGVNTNVSGLSWLISGSQTNGTSFAPYVFGITDTLKFQVSAQTVLTSTGNTGAQYSFIPLAPNATSTTLNVFNASEGYQASKILTLPDAPNTVSTTGPQLSRTYKMCDLFGVDEQTYLSSPSAYGFYYGGANDNICNICLISGTQSGSTDATLTTRVTVKMIFSIIFLQRNTLNVNAPHS